MSADEQRVPGVSDTKRGEEKSKRRRSDCERPIGDRARELSPLTPGSVHPLCRVTYFCEGIGLSLPRVSGFLSQHLPADTNT